MRILILGCGWLAESFAIHMKHQGHEVWASTTTSEKYHRLKADGIFSFILDFDYENFPAQVVLPTQFDFVLNSIPASQKNSVAILENRFSNIKSFYAHMTWKKQVFLSSIGIYPDKDGVFDESYADTTELSSKLLLAEASMLGLADTIIYRLAGLFGKNRVFAKYFAERICTTGEQPANFVHIDDVIRLLEAASCNALKYTVYNVVAPLHPKKKDVILASAKKYGYALPLAFEAADATQKIVSGRLLLEELDYQFVLPDPLQF
ncbi:GDP-L-fucose synthase [Sphingobacterium sp.]|uniref:GDP-L-fucose synthase n=1 Tax=Sphingobacterium sp. TaxID=341027 RepID=UPI002590F903|nr:GDP-L-fucose synthase [Sphingobacterium sp.]WET67455.1 MAG: GDP-L-fucose synthase [Sphingobacterium sp.]